MSAAASEGGFASQAEGSPHPGAPGLRNQTMFGIHMDGTYESEHQLNDGRDGGYVTRDLLTFAHCNTIRMLSSAMGRRMLLKRCRLDGCIVGRISSARNYHDSGYGMNSMTRSMEIITSGSRTSSLPPRPCSGNCREDGST